MALFDPADHNIPSGLLVGYLERHGFLFRRRHYDPELHINATLPSYEFLPWSSYDPDGLYEIYTTGQRIKELLPANVRWHIYPKDAQVFRTPTWPPSLPTTTTVLDSERMSHSVTDLPRLLYRTHRVYDLGHARRRLMNRDYLVPRVVHGTPHAFLDNLTDPNDGLARLVEYAYVMDRYARRLMPVDTEYILAFENGFDTPVVNHALTDYVDADISFTELLPGFDPAYDRPNLDLLPGLRERIYRYFDYHGINYIRQLGDYEVAQLACWGHDLDLYYFQPFYSRYHLTWILHNPERSLAEADMLTEFYPDEFENNDIRYPTHQLYNALLDYGFDRAHLDEIPITRGTPSLGELHHYIEHFGGRWTFECVLVPSPLQDPPSLRGLRLTTR